jgi:hypothetical protein
MGMDKKELVRKLLRKGIMVTPDDLERLNEENLEEFVRNRGFKKTHANGPETQEAGDGEKSGADQSEAGTGLRISVARAEAKPRISTQDFVSFYRERFQTLRGLLAKRVDAVSINKTRNVFSNLSVIGMVKEKTGRGFIIEDETGEIEAVTDQELGEDDVVGVTGLVKEGRLFAGEITFPDLPFNRDIGKLAGVRIFIGRSLPKDAEADAFFIAGKAESERKDVTSGLSSPSAIVLVRENERVAMLYFMPGPGAGLHQAGEWLKKRHLPLGREDVLGPMDHSVLDPVPDIIWLDLEEKGSSLHKGVLVVSPGPGGALVDLESKEVEFV